MRCPQCDGNGITMFESQCWFCGGSGVVEPLTNEEWLHTLSTEEKADLLFGTFYLAGRNDEKRGDWKGVDTIMEWLKQPHTPKE